MIYTALNTMDVQKDLHCWNTYNYSFSLKQKKKAQCENSVAASFFFTQYETSAFNLNQRSIILLCNQNKLIHLFLFICLNLVKEMRRKAVVRN